MNNCTTKSEILKLLVALLFFSITVPTYGQVGLNIEVGTPATAVDGGYIITGKLDGANVGIDNHGIQARNNGGVGYLCLNCDGGGVFITRGTDVSATAGQFLQMGFSSEFNLGIDNNEIQARNNGVASPLCLNCEGGGVFISRGTEVSATAGRFLQMGLTNGFNMGIDNNEIQARNNGVASTLLLNRGGGNVVIGNGDRVVPYALTVRSDNINTKGLIVYGESEFSNKVIVAGADVAEKFNINSSNVKAGMLVSIDPKNPGELIISQQAYDKKIAGVISGANGVNAGMLLAQKGTLADGDTPVAIAGRVYCYADAAASPIEVGDFLTTSHVAGFAMKATDLDKARGAIIGKAMTALNEGQGMVLILITLQ